MKGNMKEQHIRRKVVGSVRNIKLLVQFPTMLFGEISPKYRPELAKNAHYLMSQSSSTDQPFRMSQPKKSTYINWNSSDIVCDIWYISIGVASNILYV